LKRDITLGRTESGITPLARLERLLYEAEADEMHATALWDIALEDWS